jgi:hypothetical protein
MVLPIPPINNNPIPNNPFYFPFTNFLQSGTGPLIVGTGFSIDYASGVISATGGGGGGGIVNAIVPGLGISVTGTATNPIVSNTGVLNIVSGGGILVTNVGGVYTLTNTGPTSSGTVTSITAGTGLLGGTITSTGTISLAPSGVAPATYVNPTITVDAFGRIVFVSPSGGYSATAPLTLVGNNFSVNAASTLASGVVQLNDTVTSTSPTQAGTANSVRVAYDFAATANATANSASLSAAAAISAANLAQTTANAALPTTGGTITGNISFAATQTFPVTGIPDATTGSKGVVQLATNAEVQTGTDSTKAVVSSSLQSKLSDSISTTSSTTIASSTAVKAAYDIGAAAIPCAAITAKGAIITGTAASTPTALAVGTDGQVLTACAACASGLTWAVGGGGGGGTPATPLVLGTVFGCTLSAANLSTAYGYCADFASGGSRTTAIGYQAGASEQGLSSCNTYVGHQSGFVNNGVNNTYVGALTNSATVFCSRNDNTLVGFSAGRTLGSVINNNCNTLIGSFAGCALTSQNNTFLGAYAGTTVTTGTGNLAIGSNVSVASPTGNNQLAIGWGSGSTWLTGTNTGAIKPSAGIIDSANSCGTAQQVLFSTGANAVVWCGLNQVSVPPNYGCSINLVTQTATAINTASPVVYPTSVFSSPQVVIDGIDGEFVSGVGGPYLVQLDAQLLNTVSGGSNVEFWLATVSGSGPKVYTPVPNTGRKVVVANAGETQLVNLSYQALLNTSFYAIMWATDDLNTQLVASASAMGGPTSPSAALSVMPVGF